MQKTKTYKGLRLILGDQLNVDHSWFKDKAWLYVMMEVKTESEYVTHHIQKIVGIFQAMRSFASDIRGKNIDLIYYKINDTNNKQSFEQNITDLLEKHHLQNFEYQDPDEWRLDELLSKIPNAKMVSSEHFLTSRTELENFFEGKKTYLMESFYRYMRKKHNILMDGNQPLTGKWNYDKSNRKKLPKNHKPPEPYLLSSDLSEIYNDVLRAELNFIGNINPAKFIWPKNRAESLQILDFFLNHLLSNFGDYQDALSQEYWSLYHSRISFSLNIKMLHPMDVIQQVEAAFHARKDLSINAVEGYIRQILGWREYMRGLYWAKMPSYKQMNYFEYSSPLPKFFWDGKTKMNCLSKAIGQSLDTAYAHHIQRLMITGNFALLAECNPDEVDLWYLGIYIDAFEWVEITNTRGMSQYADGGIVATKPYVSSSSYIYKMGDYCTNCYYKHKLKTGEKSCPFNSLYWNFIDRNKAKLKTNHRMGMMLALWENMDIEKKTALLGQATLYLQDINNL